MFMLFINDIVQSINSDLDSIFTIDECKLFILLYVDKDFLHKVRILYYIFKTLVDQCRICSHIKCPFKIYHLCQLLIHNMTKSLLLLYQCILNHSVLI